MGVPSVDECPSSEVSGASERTNHRRRKLKQQENQGVPVPVLHEHPEDGKSEKQQSKVRKSSGPSKDKPKNKEKEKEKAKDKSDLRSRYVKCSIQSWLFMAGVLFCILEIIFVVDFAGTKKPVQQVNFRLQEFSLEQKEQTEFRWNADSLPENLTSGIENDPLLGKGPILDLLSRAGVRVDPIKDKELFDELPTWADVVQLYGPRPVIHGLDQCARFQTAGDPADHFVSTAGTFNSGTNLMAELLIANCHMQARMDKYGAQNRGVRWQVAWGKHTPPGDEAFRQSHKTSHDKTIDANAVLPAVTIRDPLVWLASMCRHPYTAKWDRPDLNHCPDFSLPSLKTRVKYAEFYRSHDSILHLWNDYYREYLEADFPRLIVRFEDLVFHPEEVTKTVCQCAGGSMRKDGRFIYILDSAKKGEHAHGKVRTGFVDAIVKYGSERRRYQSYSSPLDLAFVRENVDKELMNFMQYPPPLPEKAAGGVKQE